MELRSPRAPSNLKQGDYVFASRWSDCDWNDPWAVGFVSAVGKNYIQVAGEDGSLIDSVGNRAFPYAMKISREQGKLVLDCYPGAEGLPFSVEEAIEIFGIAAEAAGGDKRDGNRI